MVALDVLEDHRGSIVALCQRYRVARLWLFGSCLGPNWDPVSSDFDFLAEYLPASRELPPLDRLVGLKMDLEVLLGREVDVVDWGAARNPYFRETARSQAREFYAA